MNFEAIPYQSRELFFVLLALVVALPIAMVTWVAQKRWW
jgi:Mg2+ and Co2+ transporter CorA